MPPTSPYRPEFEAALRLFAQVSEAMATKGFQRPILVGGAAAEFWSKSEINTGITGITVTVHSIADTSSRIGEETFGDYGIEKLQG